MGRICRGVQAMAQRSQKLRPTVERSWCSELLRSGAFPGKRLKPGDKTSVLSCNAGRTWKSLSPYNSKNKKNKWENLDFSQTFLGLRLQAQLPPKIRGVTARTIMSRAENSEATSQSGDSGWLTCSEGTQWAPVGKREEKTLLFRQGWKGDQ